MLSWLVVTYCFVIGLNSIERDQGRKKYIVALCLPHKSSVQTLGRSLTATDRFNLVVTQKSAGSLQTFYNFLCIPVPADKKTIIILSSLHSLQKCHSQWFIIHQYLCIKQRKRKHEISVLPSQEFKVDVTDKHDYKQLYNLEP